MARRAEPREAARLAWDDTKEARRVGEELSQVVVVDICVICYCVLKHSDHSTGGTPRAKTPRASRPRKTWPHVASNTVSLTRLSLVFSGAFPLIHKDTRGRHTRHTNTHALEATRSCSNDLLFPSVSCPFCSRCSSASICIHHQSRAATQTRIVCMHSRSHISVSHINSSWDAQIAHSSFVVHLSRPPPHTLRVSSRPVFALSSVGVSQFEPCSCSICLRRSSLDVPEPACEASSGTSASANAERPVPGAPCAAEVPLPPEAPPPPRDVRRLRAPDDADAASLCLLATSCSRRACSSAVA